MTTTPTTATSKNPNYPNEPTTTAILSSLLSSSSTTTTTSTSTIRSNGKIVVPLPQPQEQQQQEQQPQQQQQQPQLLRRATTKEPNLYQPNQQHQDNNPQQQQQQQHEDGHNNNNNKKSRKKKNSAAATAVTMFRIGSWIQFSMSSRARMVDAVLDGASCFMEGFVWLIGPLLILLALGIVSIFCFTFFTILVPMLLDKYQRQEVVWNYNYPADGASGWWLGISTSAKISFHLCWTCYLVYSVLFQYAMCVLTRNAGPKSSYQAVVEELAFATDFVLPTTVTQIQDYKRDFDDRMMLRIRRQRARMMEAQTQAQQQAQATSSSAASSLAVNGVSAAAAAAANGGECTTTTTTTTTTSPVMAVVDESSASSSSTTTTAYRRTNATTNTTSPNSKQSTILPMTHAGASTTTTASCTTLTTMNRTILPTAAAAAAVPPPVPVLPPIRKWQLMAPFEWGYCYNSHQPKPPRSHYDHVTKQLVLNLDHYCPWMFNAIGYFNYRYFVNFLLYICVGMMYACFLTWTPFWLLGTDIYHEQRQSIQQLQRYARQQQNQQQQSQHYSLRLRPQDLPPRLVPMLPYPEEKMLLTLCFMLSVAVGLAVFLLASFHIYLTVTAQTTIEFHANWTARRRAKKMGLKWKNPYCQGNWKRNWQQVYGNGYGYSTSTSRTAAVSNGNRVVAIMTSWTGLLLSILVPSRREPEYLPVPIPGKNYPRSYFRRQLLQKQQQSQDTQPPTLLYGGGGSSTASLSQGTTAEYSV